MNVAKTDNGESSSMWGRLLGRSAPAISTPVDEIPKIDVPLTPEPPSKPAGVAQIDYFSATFGLTERAFTLLPDPDYLYWSPGHKRAYSVLEYGIMTRAPITVITGDVGAGKTTLMHALLDKITDDTTVGLISNAHGNRGDLLRWALSALDVPCDREASYVETFQILQDFLIQNYADGRYTILIIDEAQQLSPEALEELRMLTNINSKKDELLQLVLIGQPELRDVIARPEMRQFAQRIMAAYHLGPMDAAATQSYILHRLVHAGGSASQFDLEACQLIHHYTGGIPRLVNKLCDFAIVYAVTADKNTINASIVRNVVKDGLLQGADSFETVGDV